MLRLQSHSLPGGFYNIYTQNRLPKTTKLKTHKKSLLKKYFEERVKMRPLCFSTVLFLIHVGFLFHALFIIYKQYLKYEVVTSTGKIKTGIEKELPRIAICPYYQMEENLWYHYKKVVYGIDNLAKKWNLPTNWGVMRGIKNKGSSQSLYLNLMKECLSNECQCDFNPHNELPQSGIGILYEPK